MSNLSPGTEVAADSGTVFVHSTLRRRERAACMQEEAEGPYLPCCLITTSMHCIASALNDEGDNRATISNIRSYQILHTSMKEIMHFIGKVLRNLCIYKIHKNSGVAQGNLLSDRRTVKDRYSGEVSLVQYCKCSEDGNLNGS